MFDGLDRVYLALRVVALAAGLSFPWLSARGAARRDVVVVCFVLFVVYGALFYLFGWKRLSKPTFYRAMAWVDLAFVAGLMALTGNAHSAFYRALYVWVAMFAFYFGMRGGRVASLAALGVFCLFRLLDERRDDSWVILAQAGGIVLHGPLIGYLRDRFETAHRQLVHSEKLSSIGLLAAGVAHEINNPLAGIMACMKTLRSRTVSEERREQYFETVCDGLERIRLTVQGLLDYARPRAPSAEELDLGETVRGCLQLLAPLLRQKDLRLRDGTGGSFHLRADRSQLMQALVNVLVNAIQASPRGGRIDVGIVERPGRLGLRVTDEGPGIPADLIDRVCDPFFTTKPAGEGTGLGLAITLGIVKAHGGELAIESQPPGGARVTIWLPTPRGVEEGIAHAGHPFV